MATLSQAESRRLYSWWWDSHISPKNSKWLQENLTDMDLKVKSMIKLIEEDADSFARRAEMYYKKRPELMKLVEEFYRAYRALAERYDHATVALRQAHRTMAEAFPNQVPFALPDDSPSGSSITDGEPRTPEMPPPGRVFAEPDDLQKDAQGQSPHVHTMKRNGAYSEEKDASNSKRGLKQLNEMFVSGEATNQTKFAEGKSRKGLTFNDEEAKIPETKMPNGSVDVLKNEKGSKASTLKKTQNLQDDISQLFSENQTLKMQIKSEHDRVAKCEREILRLQESLSNLEAEKDAALLQYQKSLERISNLEMENSVTLEDNMKLHSEMSIKLIRLEKFEEQYRLLETEKQALEVEIQELAQQKNAQQQELRSKQDELAKLKANAHERTIILQDEISHLLSENQNLKLQIQSEHDQVSTSEKEILKLQESLSKSEADKQLALLQCQKSLEDISNLEKQFAYIQEANKKLHDEMADKHARLESADGKCLLLETEKQSLEAEVHNLSQQIIVHRHELQQRQDKIEKLKDDAYERTKVLQDDVSRLQSENQNLKVQIKNEHDNVIKYEQDILRLQESLSSIETEKDASLLQCQMYLDRISNLELENSHSHERNRVLDGEMVALFAKLQNAQEQSLLLETGKKALEAELKVLTEEKSIQLQELQQKQDEVGQLKLSLEEVHKKHSQVEEALCSLEKLHSQSVEKLSTVELELHSAIEMMKGMEIRNHSLDEDIQQVKEANSNLNKELLLKKEELENLSISLQNEHLLSVKAEETLHSVEQLHAQTQEEIEILGLELQSKVELLKEMELQKCHLEEHVQQANKKNENLNEQILSSALMINNLQEENLSLKETRMKLENAVEHHLQGNEALQQVVESLQAETANLNLKHQYVVEQIEAVGLNKESFRVSVQELQDGNLRLNDLCKRHEDEKSTLIYKLGDMEKITEKNKLLEASLSDASAELEGLREKVNSLDDICDSLKGKISDLLSESSSLVSQLESTMQNNERLLENNTFLQKSLFDANIKLEELREKLKSLVESCHCLYNGNSGLHSEEITLFSQVENVHTSLENIKNCSTELEHKYTHLQQEKESAFTLVNELQTSLLSSNAWLETLSDKMKALQAVHEIKDQELEALQYRLFDQDFQAYILQSSLIDSKECYERVLVSLLCLEKLLSDVKEETAEQRKLIENVSDDNKKLRKGILLILTSPGIDDALMSVESDEEFHCDSILGKTEEARHFISDKVDEMDILRLEKSVIYTLMQQLSLDLRIIDSEKNAMVLKYNVVIQQLLALKDEKQDLLQINENLHQCVNDSCLREGSLKAEVDILDKQLLILEMDHKKAQAEICILLEANQSLSNEVSSLKVKIENLEEESSTLFMEAVNLSCLSLALEKFGAEKAVDLRICGDNLDYLHSVNSILENKVSEMAQRYESIEAENVLLKDSVVKLEECQGCLLMLQDDLNTARNIHTQLNNQIDNGNNLLTKKEMQLTEAKRKIEDSENEKINLCRDLDVIKVEFDKVLSVRKELEQEICMLRDSNLHKDNEIANIHDTNQLLDQMVKDLKEQLVDLNFNKEHLVSELCHEINLYEEEVARCWSDTHISAVHMEIFEEKILELIGECERLEISAIVQRDITEEQIVLSSLYSGQLNKKLDCLERESSMLKNKLQAYLPLVLSLQDSISSLENQVLSLVRQCRLEDHPMQDTSSSKHELIEHHGQLSAECVIVESDGIMELQKLLARIEQLQKVLLTFNLGIQESDTSDKSATRELITELSFSGQNCGELEVQTKEETTVELQIDAHQSGEVALQPGGAEIESSKVGYGLTMKDIQLDQSSFGDSSTYKRGGVGNAETDEQMLKLWEAAENDCNSEILRASSITNADDIDHQHTELVEEVKSDHPCEPVVEKELGVVKLRMSRKVDNQREWSKRISDRLASDAQRLSILQQTIQELKRHSENSASSDIATNTKYDTLKGQLKRAEEAISGLVDINTNLTKQAVDWSTSPDGNRGEREESRKQQRRQVSDHVQNASDKIVRLELELQKIQYILLKLDEERENRARAAEEKSRVILRDYLYGRREKYRRKKSHLCGCVRPRTSDD